MPEIILVDESDNEVGLCEKMEAHRLGKLHRAFSVFIFNSKNELLLQKRSQGKYHCGGLWSNTCCSHPVQGEDLQSSAESRLEDEMGLSCGLSKIFHIIYQAHFSNGLVEYEYDHVFAGQTDGTPSINKAEVDDWKYMGIDELRKDIIDNENRYTPWLRFILDKMAEIEFFDCLAEKNEIGLQSLG